MALMLDATVGGAASNSYATVVEADAYFEARIDLPTPWGDSDASKDTLLVMGTRVLDAAFRGQRILVPASGAVRAYWKIGRKWEGSPATLTQRLAWPRTGLLHDNGSVVAADEIPWELKDALAELAGQLGGTDRTLDNKIITQGITSAKAGSVAVTFRNAVIFPATLPQAVIDLVPPSWYEEEVDEPTIPFDFAVVLR